MRKDAVYSVFLAEKWVPIRVHLFQIQASFLIFLSVFVKGDKNLFSNRQC